ncbi:MAG TPA: N-acyl homoserine lactonase family protein [Solirubrobacterales bacterium]
MKVQVEAKPLHEPLSGGTPGATVTVEPIVTGTTNFPRALMESPGGRFLGARLGWALLTGKEATEVPCPVFLIRHPSAGAILVDTGLHPSIATDAEENFGRLPTRFGKPNVRPDGDAPAQLRKRGLDPGEIPVVVMTHLHIDHTSAISEFPNSTFVASELEWQDATQGSRPTLKGYRRIHLDFAFDYRTVDFDRGGIGSYATFGRTFDLFGDGSVRLAYTPGHSAGHMSVVARLKETDFVIGGDAAYTLAQLDGVAPLPPRPFDAHNYRRSLQELRLFRREYPAAVVTPGHDAGFYEGLEPRYE